MIGFHQHDFSTFVDAGHYNITYTNRTTGKTVKGSLITLVTSKCDCGKFSQQKLDGGLNVETIKKGFFHIL